jgi:Zn-dependent protease with chaperone function
MPSAKEPSFEKLSLVFNYYVKLRLFCIQMSIAILGAFVPIAVALVQYLGLTVEYIVFVIAIGLVGFFALICLASHYKSIIDDILLNLGVSEKQLLAKKASAKEKRLMDFLVETIKEEGLKADVRFPGNGRSNRGAYMHEGLFRDHVVVPRGMFSKLTEGELKAVGLHEIAHAKYQHPQKKSSAFLRSVAPFLIIFSVIVFTTWCLGWIIPPMLTSLGYGLFMAFALLWGLHFCFKRARWTELQADSYAKRKIGDSKVVITALTKIIRNERRGRFLETMIKLAPMHPTLEERIKNLKEDLVPAP